MNKIETIKRVVQNIKPTAFELVWLSLGLFMIAEGLVGRTWVLTMFGFYVSNDVVSSLLKDSVDRCNERAGGK